VTRLVPRTVLLVVGVASIIVAVVPPVSIWARTTEVAQAIQFLLLSVVGPPLIVCSAPWGRLGLSAHELIEPSPDGVVELEDPVRPMDRMVVARLSRRDAWRGVGVGALGCGIVVLWRLPFLIAASVDHEWVLLVEALTLAPIMGMLWLELVSSPPSEPRLTRPMRIAVSAVVMWTVWVTAYLMGLSSHVWYSGTAHVAGQGLSLTADQQLAAGFIWIVSAAAFLPVIFSNLVRWIQSDEDPDDELYRLIRAERRVAAPDVDDSHGS